MVDSAKSRTSRMRRPPQSAQSTSEKEWPYERRSGDSRVWSRTGFEGIGYSDGKEAETELLAFLKQASDLGSLSDELAAGIESWMQEAHLSPARANLLRALDWTGRRRVLELGAGCGALTRYLGEEGLHVDAVEGSVLRAECAAERCRDLTRVRVIADEITAFEGDGTYDVVTLIGVLEYSRVFIDAEDPVLACLQIARRHLSPDGVLVLAIENQLGLKYFNACAEDHLGTPFSGITDLYGRKTAVTFGKVELEAKLREAGFARVDWSYPFPDYKLPTTVLSSRALHDVEFSPGEMLLGESSRDYSGSVMRSFDEGAVWGVLARNDLLGALANSFLVVASLQPANPLDDGSWLACRYSPHRLKDFSTTTRIARRAEGLMVNKTSLIPSDHRPVGIDGGLRVEQRTGAEPYVRGRLLAHDFMDAVARGHAPADLAQFLTSWIDLLASHALARDGVPLSSLRIPGHLLDCVPTNIVVDDEGRLCPIDLEFAVPGDIPITWVALRGTIHLVTKCFGHRELLHTSFKSFLEQILPALGFGDVQDWSEAFELEDSLIRAVLRTWPGRPERDILRSRLDLPIATISSIVEYQRVVQASDLAGGRDMPAVQSALELSEHLGRWLALLPDPAPQVDARGDHERSNVELASVSEAMARNLQAIFGTDFHGRIRDLALLRGRWAALARDNQKLARELNDAQEQVQSLRPKLSQAESLAAHQRPFHEEIEALRKRLDEQLARVSETERAVEEARRAEREAMRVTQERDRHVVSLEREVAALKDTLRHELARFSATKEELDQTRLQLAAAEATLEDFVSHRPNQQRWDTLSAELATAREAAQRHVVAKLSLQAELDAAKATLAKTERFLSRDEGRTSVLREEVMALKSESRMLRETLDNATNRLRRRGAEISRLHRKLREISTRKEALQEQTPRSRGARWLPWPRRATRDSEPEPVEPEILARAQALRASGLFYVAWYERKYGAAEVGADPAVHYLRMSASGRFDPNPLFHEGWYRAQYDSTFNPGESGLEHYLRIGSANGCEPNELFDTEWYLGMNPDLRGYSAGALHHYLSLGWREGRDPHPLFDTDWFLAQYPDAANVAEQLNPLAYFFEMVNTGGHSPCELFDTEWYLSQYADVEAAGFNPLLHYLAHGAREGRNPSPNFDTRWYLETYRDVAASGMNPLLHYRIAGLSEGRRPMPRKAAEAAALEGVVTAAAEVVVDGSQEWSDYEPLKNRIAAEAQLALGRVRHVPPPMVSVVEDTIGAALAALVFERHDSPRVSIVIPVYNKLSLTLECLTSIHECRTAVPFEIIISDDGSTDGSGERLASVPGLVVHRNEHNLGFLRNCNSAFPLARGEYVLLLNNDVQVTPGWLDAMLGTFDAFERVGAVGPKIVYPSGHLQEAGVAVRGDGSVEMVGLFDDPQKDRYNYARAVDYVSGACLMLRTAMLRELDGLSEEFLPCYCEDSDLCMRIRQRGLRIMYQPDATVVHHLSKTTADSAHDVKLRAVGGSLATFTGKWQQDLDRLTQVRVLAFYLPQFHPIPENDHWWGAGFTEWANVTRALPNFLGHYQPRLPADLGFYDLRLPEVLEKQAALARRYGLHGFCFYYYWFAGKRLLERPIETLLATGRPDIPYCLCWANENWTRRWDGEDQEILIAQKYSPEDDEAVIRDLMRHFRNPNYIRIDGKPVLLVYRVSQFPDFRATADRWRALCRREGIGDIYLAMVESFDLVNAGAHPGSYNCDASVEFPPLGMAQPRPPSGPIINPEFMGNVADYRDIAARFCARPMPRYTRFRGVMAGWDNTARRQNNSYCFENATPGAFQAWLESAIRDTRSQHHGDERMLFVNAWNEWAEGAYLEPDRRYGHAFLEAVRNAQEADALLRMDRYALDL